MSGVSNVERLESDDSILTEASAAMSNVTNETESEDDEYEYLDLSDVDEEYLDEKNLSSDVSVLNRIPFQRLHEPQLPFKDPKRRCFMPGQKINVEVVDMEPVERTTPRLLSPDLYVVRVQHGDYEWEVKRRHKHFKQIHDRLRLMRAAAKIPVPTHRHRERRKSLAHQASLPKFPKRPDPAIRVSEMETRKKQLTDYLQNILRYSNHRQDQRVLQFLEVSHLSFVHGLGQKWKEGEVRKRSGGRKISLHLCDCCGVCTAHWDKRWLFVKDTFVAYVHPESGVIGDVLLLDQDFVVEHGLVKTGVRHGLLVSNYSRNLLVKCWTQRKAQEWHEQLTYVAEHVATDFTKPNRFNSFAPVRKDAYVNWFVDAATYMAAVADALDTAKEEIFITDWWLSPELYLKRPVVGEQWRLDYILKRKASEGVKVFILLFKEMEVALGINSFYSKAALHRMHPNIKVLRHPDGINLWSHHEKCVVIDQRLAFLGGIDLCYGRWDTRLHRLTDLGSVSISQFYGEGETHSAQTAVSALPALNWRSASGRSVRSLRTIPEASPRSVLRDIIIERVDTEDTVLTAEDGEEESEVATKEFVRRSLEKAARTKGDDVVDDVMVNGVTNKGVVLEEGVMRQASVTQEAVTRQASVTQEAVTRQASVTQEAVTRQASVTQEAVTRQASVTQEAVARQASVTQEVGVTRQASVTQEVGVTRQASVTQEASVTRQASVTQEASVTRQASVTQEAGVTRHASFTRQASVTQEVGVTRQASVTQEVGVTRQASVTLEGGVIGQASVTQETHVTRQASLTRQASVSQEDDEPLPDSSSVSSPTRKTLERQSHVVNGAIIQGPDLRPVCDDEHSVSLESPQASLRISTSESSRASPHESSRASPHESSRASPCESSRASPHGSFRASPHESSRASPHESSRAKHHVSFSDSPSNSFRDSPRESSRESPRESSRAPPHESSRAKHHVSFSDSPSNSFRDSPRESSRESPSESSRAAPNESSRGLSRESSRALPNNSPTQSCSQTVVPVVTHVRPMKTDSSLDKVATESNDVSHPTAVRSPSEESNISVEPFKVYLSNLHQHTVTAVDQNENQSSLNNGPTQQNLGSSPRITGKAKSPLGRRAPRLHLNMPHMTGFKAPGSPSTRGEDTDPSNKKYANAWKRLSRQIITQNGGAALHPKPSTPPTERHRFQNIKERFWRQKSMSIDITEDRPRDESMYFRKERESTYDPYNTLEEQGLTGEFKLWIGKDYVNFIFKDFVELDKPFHDMVDRTVTPRMPWHDIGAACFGRPARDVARHFIQRWNFTKLQKQKNNNDFPMLLPKSYQHITVPSWVSQSAFTCNCQILRSACEWSAGIKTVESSIHNAYKELIHSANHYIFIENQFFISIMDNSLVENMIAEALFSRIVKAHKHGETFRVYVVLPLLPAFEGELGTSRGTSIQTIIHWNYASISRGGRSLLEKLVPIVGDPFKYISFYGLRTHEELQGTLMTELVYVHSKMMIVDDRSVIIGSANINDRSLLGKRDSELAIVVHDTQTVPSVMDGQPYQAGAFASSLRKNLFREHLGAMDDEQQDLRDPVCEHFYKRVWLHQAGVNTSVYEKVFRCLPTDTVTSFKNLREYQQEDGLVVTDLVKAREELNKVKGHLVLMPLRFLQDEKLEPSAGTKESLAPTVIWT